MTDEDELEKIFNEKLFTAKRGGEHGAPNEATAEMHENGYKSGEEAISARMDALGLDGEANALGSAGPPVHVWTDLAHSADGCCPPPQGCQTGRLPRPAKQPLQEISGNRPRGIKFSGPVYYSGIGGAKVEDGRLASVSLDGMYESMGSGSKEIENKEIGVNESINKDDKNLACGSVCSGDGAYKSGIVAGDNISADGLNSVNKLADGLKNINELSNIITNASTGTNAHPTASAHFTANTNDITSVSPPAHSTPPEQLSTTPVKSKIAEEFERFKRVQMETLRMKSKVYRFIHQELYEMDRKYLARIEELERENADLRQLMERMDRRYKKYQEFVEVNVKRLKTDMMMKMREYKKSRQYN